MFNAGFAAGAGGARNNFFAQMMQGHGLHGPGPSPPQAYDDYFKAYSTTMMETGSSNRDNLTHGGKIIMPPSALARLTNLEIEGPWNFALSSPKSSVLKTHAGVLEFIAPEGIVHLPPWMMRTLELNEGDMLRVVGCVLPKGKMVKIQAQDPLFLEVGDPKAVLESALRNFSCLTQGDIISISYNSISFEFLIMETTPVGEGISCMDTDLEVDFATPKGYIEPARPAPPPVQSMASKLQIDLNKKVHSAATSADGNSGEGDFEAFTGGGRTLSGRRTKGKGLKRAIEGVEDGSMIWRTDKPRMATNDTIASDVKVPAALNLPFGKLFFGFTYKPFEPPASSGNAVAGPSSVPVIPFATGGGATLSGRAPPPSQQQSTSSSPSTATSAASNVKKESSNWGGTGNTLNGSRNSREVIEIDDDSD